MTEDEILQEIRETVKGLRGAEFPLEMNIAKLKLAGMRVILYRLAYLLAEFGRLDRGGIL